MADERLRVAYEEGRRALDLQSHSLDELRGRSSTLATIAVVTTAFLSSLALQGGRPPNVLTWLALALFVILIVALCAILLPRTFIFTNDPLVLVETWIDDQERDLDDTFRHLARYYGENCKTNQIVIDRLSWAFTLATGALCLSILLMLTDLATRN